MLFRSSSPQDVVDEVNEAGAKHRDAVVLLIERSGDARFVAVDLA